MYKFVRSFKKKPLNEDKKEEFNKDQSNVNTSSNLSSENEQKKDRNDSKKPLSSIKPNSGHESFVNSKMNSQSVKRSYSHQKKDTTSSDKSDNQSSRYRSTSTSSSSSTIAKPSSSSSQSSLATSLQSSTETVNNTIIINSERDLDLLEKLFSNPSSKATQDGKTDRLVAKSQNIPKNTQNKRKLVNIIRQLSEDRNKTAQNRSQSMVLTGKRSAENHKPLFKSRTRKDPLVYDEDKIERNSKPLKNVNFRILKDSHRKIESDGSYRVIAQEPVRANTAQNHYLEISSTPCKRLRSPSNHEYNSLLNLAHNQSLNNRSMKKITIKPLPRSLSVNYLYHKRQGDLRRYQKNALIKIRLKRTGFTTEDIDDIYMPTQLDMFERKLKQSMDISDNSELDEAKMREERLSRVRNKRFKHDMDKNGQRSKIIINYTTRPFNQAEYLDDKKSYLEEAKRKLDMMKNSNGYYYNLNNKLKSSVTNLIRASQDLARTSEIKSKLINRNWSLKEVYDIRRNQIRSNNLNAITSDNSTQVQNNFTCDDINNVYMPWMIENYGRKLAIEAMRRKTQTEAQKKAKVPYVSQYYAKSSDYNSIGHDDLWLIDRDIRRHLKNASNSSLSDSDVSMTDTETSSDDTRPIVPQKINKPDNSLKNKILKAINKSLLTSEVSGIDLNLLKLNDSVKRTLKRVEKRALERDLEHDLIRSFSCSHLADLRKEDIKYVNMRKIGMSSYSTDDIQDLYIPKMLENFKLKLAVEKEFKPRRILRKKYSLEELNTALVTSPPPVQIKSPSIATPTSLHYSNTDNLFKQIIQERISEFDHRIASEISSSAKKRTDEDDVSTDHDQDDSIEISSDSDDFNISEHEMKHFDSTISKSKIESAINKSLALKNPGELISDFYISNMNFAMRYSVEYIQKIANEMRLRRHLQDSMFFHSDKESKLRNRVQRSFSVDRLYAVRKEHLRYSNGAQNKRISFTTDDIQDIYMPSCLDNYKRKIAVELERRRRHAEETNFDLENEMNENLNLLKQSKPIVLDDLDIFLIEKSNFSIEENNLDNKIVKMDQPVILMDKNRPEYGQKQEIEQVEKVIAYQPVINYDSRSPNKKTEFNLRPEKAKLSFEPQKLHNVQQNSIKFKSAEDKARFERAKVSIQKRLSFFENYPLVSHIEQVFHDEPIQVDQDKTNFNNYTKTGDINEIEKSDSSSMTSSVSAVSSDSLSNIPLDNFEQKYEQSKIIKDRASMTLVPDDKTGHGPIRVIKMEQMPVLEKSNIKYEQQKFDLATINSVKSMNMPKESLDIVSRLYSNYFQPEKVQIQEPNFTVVQDDLRSVPLIHKPNAVFLNAPNVERQEIYSLKDEAYQPLNTKRPEYVIEEYAKKPLNSEVTFSYENLHSFRVNDLKDNANIGLNENELVCIHSNCEKTFYSPSNQDQTMSLPEQIETVRILNAQEMVELPQFESSRLTVLVPTDVKNAEQLEQREYELEEFIDEAESEKNLSIKEEVENTGRVSITEFKQVEEPYIDEISLSDADSIHFETYELESVQKMERTSPEINQPLSPVKNKVYNLPKKSDFVENTTEEFYAPAMETDQVEQIENVQRLELCQKPHKASVLNLARQDSLQSLKSQTENIPFDDKIQECESSKQEISQFSSKPSAKKPLSLNAPFVEHQVIESIMANELETKEDIGLTMLSPKQNELLDKAFVEPRPVCLNQAESNVSHEEVETLQYMEDVSTDKETIEPKNEIACQTQNLHVSHPVRTLNLGDEKADIFLYNTANDYEQIMEEPMFALVKSEEELSSKIERPGMVDVLNGPIISTKVDDFLETIKPLDPIELDFEEQVSISTKKPDINQPNDIKVSIKKSYGQSDIEEIYYNENCSELDKTDTAIQPYYRENKIDLQYPHGIRIGLVEKIGYAKEETSSIKNEEPIEFETSRCEESVLPNFEPKTNMNRLGEFKSQTVLNNPEMGHLNIQTVEKFTADRINYQKPDLMVEDEESLDQKYITRIQCFNNAQESSVPEHEETPMELKTDFNQMESRISTETLSDYQKDNQVIDILAQIVKQRTSSSYASDSEDSLENLKKNITMDSMQSFLDNVVKTAKQTIDSKNDDLSDEETSIQEMVLINQNFLNQDEKKIIKPDKYKISTIKGSLCEPDNFEGDKVIMIDGNSIARVVEPSSEIKDFEEAVEIVDSVMIDHTSEDDKSTTSEEVTFERWTEETKLIKTQIFKNGNLVEEIVKQSNPELIGNILKEKIIERHEHVKHVSQDVLKRVRIKSPGQSRRQSLDIQEILNEDLDGSNIIIVEPTITSIRPVSAKDNTYYIQHQQVITPTQSSDTSVMK